MIKPLTSLRFFFALAIFLRHSVCTPDPTALSRRLYQNVFAEGFLGVSFFFILSGFIIALNYSERFINGRITIKQFYLYRFARIYPLYLLSILIAIPLTIVEIRADIAIWTVKLCLTVFAIQSFIPNQNFAYAFNIPAWSISDEVFFYLMFPLTILVITRNWYWKAFLPLSTLVLIICMYNVPAEWRLPLFYWNPVTRILDFMIGIGIYELYQSTQSTTRQWSAPKAGWFELAAIALFGLFFALHDRIEIVYRYSVWYWIPMSAVIYVYAHAKGWVSKVLSNRMFVILGEVSFAFYLFHYLILRYLLIFNTRYSCGMSEVYITSTCFVLTLGASLIAHYYFEKPMNRYLRSKLVSVKGQL